MKSPSSVAKRLTQQTDEIQVDTLGDYTERGGAKYISYTEYADEAPYNGQPQSAQNRK